MAKRRRSGGKNMWLWILGLGAVGFYFYSKSASAAGTAAATGTSGSGGANPLVNSGAASTSTAAVGTAAGAAFANNTPVNLYPPNGAASMVINYGQIAGSPSVGDTFSYGGMQWVLSQDSAGNLYSVG